MKVLSAPPDTQMLADKLFNPMNAAIVNYRHQQEYLAYSRDLLLPRLISGELSVSAAERELETAA